MRKKIGKLQIEYLETIKEIRIVLIKMQEFLNMKDLDTVLVYRNVILELKKGLPELLSIFGYEHDLPDYMEAIKLFDECQKRKDILTQEDACKDALKILIALTGKILEHTNEKQKICNCCGAEIYYTPLSGYYDQQESKELLINNHLQNMPNCVILCSNNSGDIGGKYGYKCRCFKT